MQSLTCLHTYRVYYGDGVEASLQLTLLDIRKIAFGGNSEEPDLLEALQTLRKNTFNAPPLPLAQRRTEHHEPSRGRTTEPSFCRRDRWMPRCCCCCDWVSPSRSRSSIRGGAFGRASRFPFGWRSGFRTKKWPTHGMQSTTAIERSLLGTRLR